MSKFSVIDHGNENARSFKSRAEADDKAKGVKQMVSEPSQIEVVKGDYDDYSDYDAAPETEDVDAEIIDMTDGGTATGDPGTPAAQKADPRQGNSTTEVVTKDELTRVQNKDISEDPLTVMPGHFVDDIQGVPTINRKGYAVLAEHYGISVVAEPETLPSATDFEYAEFQATATTENGVEYSGFGSAHVDRMDGDDAHLLAELAETRAMKRAVSWATGIGMTAQEEMENSL